MDLTKVRLEHFAPMALGAVGALLMLLGERQVAKLRQQLRHKRRAARRLELLETSAEARKMRGNQLYNCHDELLAFMLRAAHSLCDDINAERDHERRQELVRELFNKTGDGCHVEPGLACDYGYHIEVGRNFYANYGCVLLDCAKITIGDNVFLAPNVQIYTAGHPLDAVERRTVEFAKPITIGNDCWIGGAAIILPGITIGGLCN